MVAVPLSFPIRRALVNSMSSVMKLVFKEFLQCNTVHSFLCRLWILEIRKYKVVPQALPVYTYQLVRTPCHSLVIRDELSLFTVAGNGAHSRVMIVVENKNYEKCASSFQFVTFSHLVFTCSEVKTGVMLSSGMQS